MSLLRIVFIVAVAVLLTTVHGSLDEMRSVQSSSSSSSSSAVKDLLVVNGSLVTSWRSIDDTGTERLDLRPVESGNGNAIAEGSVRVLFSRETNRQLLLLRTALDNGDKDKNNGTNEAKRVCQRFALLSLDHSTDGGRVKLDVVKIKLDSGKTVDCFERVDKVEYMVDSVSDRMIRLIVAAQVDSNDPLGVYYTPSSISLASDVPITFKKMDKIPSFNPETDNIVSLLGKRILVSVVDQDEFPQVFEWKQKDNEPSLRFDGGASDSNVQAGSRIVLPFHESGHEQLSFIVETRKENGELELTLVGMPDDSAMVKADIPLDLQPLSPLDDMALECTDEGSHCSFFFIMGKFILNSSPKYPSPVNLYELDQTIAKHEFEQWPVPFSPEKPFFWGIVRSGDTRHIVTIDTTISKAVETTRRLELPEMISVTAGTDDNDLIVATSSESIVYRAVIENNISPSVSMLYQTPQDAGDESRIVPSPVGAISNTRHVLLAQPSSTRDTASGLYTVRWMDTPGEYDQARMVLSAREGRLASLSIDAVLQLRPAGQKSAVPRMVVFFTYGAADAPSDLKSAIVELTLAMSDRCWPACSSGSNTFCSSSGICECYSDPENGYWRLSSEGKCVCANDRVMGSRCTECKKGYAGFECSAGVSCFGVPLSSKNVCGGNGRCIATDTCVCNENYFGRDCRQTSCFGIVSTSDAVCGGAGRCEQLDTCVCLPGYSGPTCTGRFSTDSGESLLVAMTMMGSVGVLVLSVVITVGVIMFRRGLSVQDLVHAVKNPIEALSGESRTKLFNGLHERLEDEDDGNDEGDSDLGSDNGMEIIVDEAEDDYEDSEMMVDLGLGDGGDDYGNDDDEGELHFSNM